MRKELNDSYDALRFTQAPIGDLKEAPPKHRVDGIEVFAESVHAVLHEHDWKVISTEMSVTNPFQVSVVFQCRSCNEVLIRHAERTSFI